MIRAELSAALATLDIEPTASLSQLRELYDRQGRQHVDIVINGIH